MEVMGVDKQERELSLEERKRKGEWAVERAIALFESLGFKVERVGVEYRYPPDELERLRKSKKLSAKERFSPDLRVSGLVEVKFSIDLVEPIYNVEEFRSQLKLQREGEPLIYAFVDKSGNVRLVPASGLLNPGVVFYYREHERRWLAQLYPRAELRRLKQFRGSGEPFARISLGPKRPAIWKRNPFKLNK
jgi:hypothetical protein